MRIVLSIALALFAVAAPPPVIADTAPPSRIDQLREKLANSKLESRDRIDTSIELAGYQLSEGDADDAKKTLQSVVAQTSGMDHALMLLHMADCDLVERDFHSASFECGSAVAELERSGVVPVTLMNDARAELGVAQFDAKLYDKALATFQKVEQASSATNNRVTLGWALLAEAAALEMTGEKDKAAEKKKGAFEAFRVALLDSQGDGRGHLPPAFGQHRLWWYICPHTSSAPGRVWRTAAPPRAVIVAVHGLGLDKESFERVARQFAARGIEVVAIDVRGFGSWQHLPGTARTANFDEAVQDIKLIVRVIGEHRPNLPVFLLGESMGGALVLAASDTSHMAGVISAVPAAERYGEFRRASKVAVHFMLNRDKDIDIGTELAADAEQNHAAVRERWTSDPHARLKISPRELLQFKRFMKSVEKGATEPQPPTLMLQGAQDHLVKADATIALFNKLNSKDKNLILLGQSEHLIFELTSLQKPLLDSVDAWITAHSKL